MNGKNLNSLTQMVNHLYFILLHLFQSSHYSALDLGSSKYNVSARVVRKEMLFENSYNMLKINYTFYILKKDDNNYNNKSFYEFEANRDLKRKLKQNIKEGLIDAFKF